MPHFYGKKAVPPHTGAVNAVAVVMAGKQAVYILAAGKGKNIC
jgi:hypothetical protein